jgi:cell division protein FtsB
MENQIKLYHDLTAFWLDKNWKTPREKQLEKQVAQLRQENNSLRMQNKALREELEPLMVFKDIPCKYCGKPMSNHWARSQVLKAFEGWGHTTCIDRHRW